MSELSPKARTMLELARQGDEPMPGTSERLERSLALKIATGAAVVTAGTYLTKSASGAALSVLKSVAVVSVGATVTVAGYKALLAPEPVASPPAVSAQAAELPARGAGGLHADSRVPLGSARVVIPAPKRTPVAPLEAGKKVQRPDAIAAESRPPPAKRVPALGAKSAERAATGAFEDVPNRAGGGSVSKRVPQDSVARRGERASVSGRGEPGLATERAKQPVADRLGPEALFVRRIQQALRRGDGPGALRLLHEADRKFPGGLLQQERAAARIQALCLAGRSPAARRQAEAFEERWPSSSLLPRVRRACH